MTGCTTFGAMWPRGARRGVLRNEAAVVLYQNSCEGGNATGWAYLTGMGTPRDRVRGFELLRKACDGGNAWAASVCGRPEEGSRRSPPANHLA